MRTRYFIIALVILAVVLAALWIGNVGSSRRYPLSVTFAGYTNIDGAGLVAFCARYGIAAEPGIHNYGRCVLLAITNSESRYLQFHSLAVEYGADGHWTRVIPKRWGGPRGAEWPAGTGKVLAIAVPPEVPVTAPWRIQFACALDLNPAPRKQLNQVARRLLGPDSLAFYAPVPMVSSDIPPARPNQSVQRTGASRSAEDANRTPLAAGSSP